MIMEEGSPAVIKHTYSWDVILVLAVQVVVNTYFHPVLLYNVVLAFHLIDDSSLQGSTESTSFPILVKFTVILQSLEL